MSAGRDDGSPAKKAADRHYLRESRIAAAREKVLERARAYAQAPANGNSDWKLVVAVVELEEAENT